MPMIRQSAVPAVEAPVSIPPFKPARPVGPLPSPANDRWLSDAADDARKLSRSSWTRRWLPYVGYAITAWEMYEIYQMLRDQSVISVPGGWAYAGSCSLWSGSVIAQGWWSSGALACATSNNRPNPPPITECKPSPNPASTFEAITVWTPNESNPAFTVRRPQHFYQRLVANPVAPAFYRWFDFYQNANITRNTPGTRPQPEPGVAPGLRPEFPSKVEPSPGLEPLPGRPGTVPGSVPGSGNVPAVPPGVDPGPRPDEWQWVPPGDTSLPTPTPHVRQPPRRYQKEQKVRNKSARLGKAIYDALDNVSEKAEIVDALFGALPKDVQDRWSKGRKDRPWIDSMGQYGIDGADWKLQALWHNWHKIDAVQAIRNIVQNHVEDAIIGRGQKYLPKNVGNAFNVRGRNASEDWSPEQQVAGWVDDLFKAVLD